jgi:hypothetical protein
LHAEAYQLMAQQALEVLKICLYLAVLLTLKSKHLLLLLLLQSP